MTFNVTYETWTTEDLEIGDTDNKGFLAQDVSLRDALYEIRQTGGNAGCPGYGGVERSGRSWYFMAGTSGDSYETDESTDAAIHADPSITESSLGRIDRLIQSGRY